MNSGIYRVYLRLVYISAFNDKTSEINRSHVKHLHELLFEFDDLPIVSMVVTITHGNEAEAY